MGNLTTNCAFLPKKPEINIVTKGDFFYYFYVLNPMVLTDHSKIFYA
ncbi:MAG: hypothetical protein QOD03_1173 [Verrucomicrobiota bacterium]|jgi:hypothetical protein